jgi:hypothetical protein
LVSINAMVACRFADHCYFLAIDALAVVRCRIAVNPALVIRIFENLWP